MKFTYDKGLDAFYIYRIEEKKAKETIDGGNVNVDIDENDEVIGVEIIDLSLVLKKITGRPLEEIKEFLEGLIDCNFEYTIDGNNAHIDIFFKSEKGQLSSGLDITSEKLEIPA